MASPKKKSTVVYEKQSSDISWYNDAIPGGTVKNNHERIIALRKAFCHPLTITPEGQLNKKYFQNITRETGQNWSDIELLQLYEGIFKHGVDSLEKWHSIKSEFLMQRDFIEVRLKLSQLLGTQDLAQYKDRSFSSEQEIKDEFEKNKKQGIEDGTWRENCQISLRPQVAKLSKTDKKGLEQKELDAWMENIYNNPHYVYRINNKRTSNTKKSKNKNKNKNKNSNNNNNKNNKNNKNKSKRSQKNKVDEMMKKQAEKANAEMEKKQKEQQQKQMEKEKEMSVEKEDAKNEDDMEQDDDGDVDIDIESKATKDKNKNKNKNKTSKKKEQQKQKQVPLIASDSEDEDMLCVE